MLNWTKQIVSQAWNECEQDAGKHEPGRDANAVYPLYAMINIFYLNLAQILNIEYYVDCMHAKWNNNL